MTGDDDRYQKEKCSFAKERNTGNKVCRFRNFQCINIIPSFFFYSLDMCNELTKQTRVRRCDDDNTTATHRSITNRTRTRVNQRFRVR
jgi:hypothetical protein